MTFLGRMNTSEALVEAALWEIMAMFGLVENSHVSLDSEGIIDQHHQFKVKQCD